MNLEQIILPMFIVALPLGILMVALRFQRQQTEARYRTLLQLADKGVDLPLSWLAVNRSPEDDRRRGVILLSGAIGLIACLLLLPVHTDQGQHIGQLWGIGLLPMMVGLGYLLNWWLGTRDAADRADGS